MSKLVKYYKVLGKGGIACNGGNGKWSLPMGKKPGEWMPKIANIEPCVRGYHLCRANDLIRWLNAEIYEAEGRGKSIRHENKDVFEQARLIRKIETWNERTDRLFTADCAEHVLPIFEKRYPNDDRPRKAIHAVRDFADGKISKENLAAARDAAGAAAWDAARDAAGAAAWDAAGAAAGAVVGDAAWAVAGAAERAAAWAVAWDAARDAAGAAAGAAAGDAENGWQTERLFFYLVR